MLEKITGAITSAINHLENSMKALVKKDEKVMMGFVWRAASDLEYALFFFSIMQQEYEGFSGKLDLHLKQVEVGPALISAQDLLKEAKSSVDAGEIREAHKKTWVARSYIFKVQETFEKKKSSTSY